MLLAHWNNHKNWPTLNQRSKFFFSFSFGFHTMLYDSSSNPLDSTFFWPPTMEHFEPLPPFFPELFGSTLMNLFTGLSRRVCSQRSHHYKRSDDVLLLRYVLRAQPFLFQGKLDIYLPISRPPHYPGCNAIACHVYA